MKVLLTGANGFVGSHVLESLLARGISTAVLLRRNCDCSFIQRHLPSIDVRTGSILEPASLAPALAGVTDAIHCAGSTKAVRPADYYVTNQEGTRNLLQAMQAVGGLRRLVHVSSLAAGGPGTPTAPAREDAPPRPVSDYGRSKLAGEEEVLKLCKTEFVIVRPPAVYGPRDRGFLPMFSAIANHILPRPSATQALSLVYVKDLAEAIATCLTHPAAAGRTYYAASPEIVTGRDVADRIGACIKTWTLPCPLAAPLLWPICLMRDGIARVTGRPSLLNLQKYAELTAPGWVCDPSRLERETGHRCGTGLAEGILKTLSWYRENRWL